jgi:hypothetical protein
MKQLDRNPTQGYPNYVSMLTVHIPTFNDQTDSFLPWVSKMKTHLRMFPMSREQQVDAIVSGSSAGTAKYLGKKCNEMTPEQIFEKLVTWKNFQQRRGRNTCNVIPIETTTR